MNIKLTRNDAQEVAHKLAVLADSSDLQDDYGLSQDQADALRNSVPLDGGQWPVPPWAVAAVREEMDDHCRILDRIASEARDNLQIGEALRTAKQAKRLAEIFA